MNDLMPPRLTITPRTAIASFPTPAPLVELIRKHFWADDIDPETCYTEIYFEITKMNGRGGAPDTEIADGIPGPVFVVVRDKDPADEDWRAYLPHEIAILKAIDGPAWDVADGCEIGEG